MEIRVIRVAVWFVRFLFIVILTNCNHKDKIKCNRVLEVDTQLDTCSKLIRIFSEFNSPGHMRDSDNNPIYDVQKPKFKIIIDYDENNIYSSDSIISLGTMTKSKQPWDIKLVKLGKCMVLKKAMSLDTSFIFYGDELRKYTIDISKTNYTEYNKCKLVVYLGRKYPIWGFSIVYYADNGLHDYIYNSGDVLELNAIDKYSSSKLQY